MSENNEETPLPEDEAPALDEVEDADEQVGEFVEEEYDMVPEDFEEEGDEDLTSEDGQVQLRGDGSGRVGEVAWNDKENEG